MGMLKCRAPQIMATSDKTSFSATLQDGQQVTWPAPPTLFIHMPRDERTAARVTPTVERLRKAGVPAAELHCKPLPITDAYFAERIEGVSLEQSAKLAQVLRGAGYLDSDNLLKDDPRGFDEWVDALQSTGVPQALQDSLERDGSRLNEEMNVAWAMHEMCATFVDEMLDFCEHPPTA